MQSFSALITFSVSCPPWPQRTWTKKRTPDRRIKRKEIPSNKVTHRNLRWSLRRNRPRQRRSWRWERWPLDYPGRIHRCVLLIVERPTSSLKPSLAENNSSLLDRFGFRKIRRQRDDGGTVLSESELEPQQAVLLAKRTEDVRMTTR